MHFFTEEQKTLLLQNPNVESITDKQIRFKGTFKIKAIDRYLKGVNPDTIFIDAGFDLSFFKNRFCYFCLKHWKKKYKEEGKESLKINKTGRNSAGRPKKENLDDLTVDELKFIINLQSELITEIKKMRALAKKNKKN